MKYRPEIDGLRALAIVPVLIHHAKLPFLGGGFLGVDVFFVISGYLITGIIADDIEKKRFSLGQFYERRARRILPALFLVCAASSFAGWMLMLPAALADFGDSLLAVLLFGSNFYFWLDQGYFHPALEEYPLLHTWSLAVEEQFYLLFPLLMVAGWRLGLRWLSVALTLACLTSLALAQWAFDHAPVANFYLAPTRAWELGLGALLSLNHHREKPFNQIRDGLNLQYAAVLGFLLVLVPMVTYTKHTPHPSAMTLAPVAGTALMLHAAHPSTWVGRLLSNPLLVRLGLISYSLYLWHQPILAFFRSTQIEELTTTQAGSAVALAIGLAYCSWRFIEQPIRNRSKTSVRALVVISLTSYCALFIYAGVISYSDGFPNRNRFADPLLKFDAGKEVGSSWSLVKEYQASQDRMKIAVVGNSHAKDFFNMLTLNHIGEDRNIEFVPIISNRICESRTRATASTRARCRRMIAEHIPDVNLFDAIILAPAWTLQGISSAQRLLRQPGASSKPILIVENGPTFRNLLPILQKSVQLGLGYDKAAFRATKAENRSDADWMNRRLRASFNDSRFHFLSRRDLACNEDRCEFIDPLGQSAYYDDSHLTLAGARFFGARLHNAPGIQTFLNQLKTQPKRPATTADSIPFP